MIQSQWATKMSRMNTMTNDPRHDKTNKVSMRPAKTQISLGIRPVWSESSLSAWRNFGLLATHWAHSEDSDQTGRMPRLIWVFAGRTLILLVLSCRGSNNSTGFQRDHVERSVDRSRWKRHVHVPRINLLHLHKEGLNLEIISSFVQTKEILS